MFKLPSVPRSSYYNYLHQWSMEGQYIPDIEPLRIDINGVVELLKN